MKRYFFIAAAAIILAILSAFVYGYEYGINPNHIQVIPFIEKIKNPSLFQGDYFVDTLKRFPSAYPYIMAFVSRWINLETLHLILFFIFKSLLLVFAYGLAYFLFRSAKTAVITMFLFAFSPLINAYGLLGHDPLMKTSFYQTSAVAPLAILAILMFLKKRYIITSVVLACIYYINALIGNFLIILFLATGGAFRLLPLFIVLMIPGAIWVAQLNIMHPLTASPDFPLFLKLWYTGHYFPSFFTTNQWYHFFIICIFFIIFFQKGMGHCQEPGKIRIFLLTLIVMWLTAYIFAEIFPLRNIILLQFLRSDEIFIALGIMFAADYIRSFFENNSIRDMAVGGLVILALIEFSKPSYKEFILAILLLAAYETQIKSFLNKITTDPERYFRFLWVVFAVFLITFSGLSFFIGASSPKMGCMFIFSIILTLPPDRKLAPSFINAALASVFVIAALSYMHIFEYRVSVADFSNPVEEKDIDWKKLQLWAKDNTPAGSVFIAPLEMNGFRVFSKRSVFVDWVDGAAMHWTPGFEEEWVNRLNKLGITNIFIKTSGASLCGLGTREIKPMHKLVYDNLAEDDFRRINKEYGAEYVVEDASRPLSFEKVYQNKTFYVYKIK